MVRIRNPDDLDPLRRSAPAPFPLGALVANSLVEYVGSVHETDSSPPPDPDDWFAESPWASPRTATVTDDVEPIARRRRPLSDLTFTLRTLLVAAGVVLALIVVLGLAIGGVFSSSGHPRTTPPASPTPRTSTPTTTPTTTAARSPSIPAPTSTLKPGDTGAQVKLLQRALAQLGEKPGSVDGDYGPSTVAAVKRFQQSSKLTEDGVVGPATLRALKRALATNSTG
jgi:Putative peptidoglycan binding domain